MLRQLSGLKIAEKGYKKPYSKISKIYFSYGPGNGPGDIDEKLSSSA